MLGIKEKSDFVEESLNVCNERWRAFIKGQQLRLITKMSPEAVQVLRSMEIIDAYRFKNQFSALECHVVFSYNQTIGTIETNNWDTTMYDWFPQKEDRYIVKDFLAVDHCPFSFEGVAKAIEKAKKEEKKQQLKERYVSGIVVDIIAKEKDFEEDIYYLVLEDGTKARLLPKKITL